MTKIMRNTLILLTTLLLAPPVALCADASVVEEVNADVVVYAATPSGICAAVAAAREGHAVILIEPSRWLGGLLGAGFRIAEDTPVKDMPGGLARRLLDEDQKWGAASLKMKPEENQQFFKKLIAAYAERIRVIYEHRVQTVTKDGARISAILLEKAPPDDWGVPAPRAIAGATLRVAGKVFIDASYEGDVMARAGVRYVVGRESRAQYNESLAGVRGLRRFPGISPYVKAGDPLSGLLPMIPAEPIGELGSSSPFGMGFNFKLAWESKPTSANPGYVVRAPNSQDPSTGELLKRIKRAGYLISWPHYNSVRDEVCTGTVPGGQRDYPDGDWPTRTRIWRAFIDHDLALTQFTKKNARLSSRANADTHSWPHQLYVREARRLLGAYVMTQADVAGQTDIPDSIGLGFYPVDFYPARLGVMDDVLIQEGAGIFLISPGPFRLAYRVITPRKSECENLLVSVCCSASHVAYAAIRLEAQYMTFGEAAGVAAAQSIAEGCAVQDIAIEELQATLRNHGQNLTWNNKAAANKYYRSFPPHVPVWWHRHPEEYIKNPPIDTDMSYVLVDDAEAVKSGDWRPATHEQPFVMEGYLSDDGEGKGTKTITFTTSLRTGGQYEVFVSYIASPKRSTKVPVCIRHTDGETRVLLDQTRKPTLDGSRFQSVGRYRFQKGSIGSVTLTTEGSEDGEVVADSALFTPVPNSEQSH